MGGVRPYCGIGPLVGDFQHLNLFGYIWAVVGILPNHI